VEKRGGDWAEVQTGTLLSGYINDMHTYVPGPDGKFGYGGKCFPKDVNAFAKMTAGTPMGELLAPLHRLNVHFRGVEERI
jgi:UDPglucose 6-dehydrogenase